MATAVQEHLAVPYKKTIYAPYYLPTLLTIYRVNNCEDRSIPTPASAKRSAIVHLVPSSSATAPAQSPVIQVNALTLAAGAVNQSFLQVHATAGVVLVASVHVQEALSTVLAVSFVQQPVWVRANVLQCARGVAS